MGKDRQSWQELECYLFDEMLICVKEKKSAQQQFVDDDTKRRLTRCTLKGSILIKKHLREVQGVQAEPILTLNLSVAELPSFHLQFQNQDQVELWRDALHDLNNPNPRPRNLNQDYENDTSGTEEEDSAKYANDTKRVSSTRSSQGVPKSAQTAPTEYSASVRTQYHRMPPAPHIPLDVVVVIPVSSSMQGLKITLLRDALRFLVQNLGERDRMGLVTFGSSGGGVPLVGMTVKTWSGWNKALNGIKPVGQKSLRADVVEGANVAMDLLMQRKSANPISTILLISDSSTSDAESVGFVVQRAEAAKVTIHSFGLGMTHKPDTMIDLSNRTKASYIYVKDWMMLRECIAGVLGALQSTSHHNVKLRLKLPEGSPAKFVKISGALQTNKRSTGREAEAHIGDLRFGDKRDILIQLAITPDVTSSEQLPQDPWDTIVSGLEALGGPLDNDEPRIASIEEVPLLQADLIFSDLLRDGAHTYSHRPSLLAITMLPASKKRQNGRPMTPPIPPHPSIVQRRMEVLTSDMMVRALALASKGQPDRAHHLLHETRTILKGLGKGGLPPLPPTNGSKSHSPTASTNGLRQSPRSGTPDRGTPSEASTIHPHSPAVDVATMAALDADIESALEWISHPAVFTRDSRKAVLQAIGVLSTQRGYTFRTPSEALWAERVTGVKRMIERSREWREVGDESLVEEA